MDSITVKELIISNGEYTWKLSIAPQGPNLCIWYQKRDKESATPLWEFVRSFSPQEEIFKMLQFVPKIE